MPAMGRLGPRSRAIIGPPFLRQSSPEILVNDETRKLAITIAATILAARALTDWDGKPVSAFRRWRCECLRESAVRRFDS
jgi:hypothetical protein